MQYLTQWLSSENEYKKTKILKEQIQDDKTLNTVIETIQYIFESPNTKPIQQVLAMRLIKELMDLHHDSIIQAISNKLVFLIEDILITDQMKNDRGKYYFSDNPDQQLMVLGNTLIRLSLECIFVWNLWHPNNLAISQIYQRLIQQGVQFPKLHYFNAQKVKEYYLSVKESSKNSTLIKQDTELLNEQHFNNIKKEILNTPLNTMKIQEINEELKQIKYANENQKKFIEDYDKAYQEYLVNQRIEDFNNQLQSICNEYEIEDRTQKKLTSAFQLSYSTDKQSHQFSSPNSDTKEKCFEKLLYDNSLIQAQLKNFELPQSSIRNSTYSRDNSQY